MDDRAGRDGWDPAVTATDGLVSGRSSGLAARLHQLIADARTDDSADARARERWLRAAAEADATFAGVLLDLGERRASVAVATVSGRRLRGVVEVVGADFVAVRTNRSDEVLVSIGAVTSLRIAPVADPAVGTRALTTELRLGDVLAELAADHPRVRLVLREGDEIVSGELRSVGQDVLTVRSDDAHGTTAYVRLAAVAEATFG